MSRMTNFILIGSMVLIVSLSTATVNSAEVFYFEKFDNLPLGPIAGPGKGLWSAPINGARWRDDQNAPGEVTDEDSFSPGQSLNFSRYDENDGRVRNSTRIDPVADLPSVVYIDQRFKHLPSDNQAGSRQLFRLGDDPEGDPNILMVFIDEDLLLKSTVGGDPVAFSSNEWHWLVAKIDGDNALVDVWLDQVLIWENLPFNGARAGSTLGLLGHNSKFHNGEERLFIDNLRVGDMNPIPEPSTLALLVGLGAVAMLRRRK